MKKELTGYPSIDKPWLKYYSEEVRNVKLPESTIYQYIWECNQDNLERIALNYYGTDIRYREMFERISYIAGTLENAGIKEGDFITVCMINSPEAIYLMLALNKIGAVANMVYGGSSTEELKKYITEAKSNIVFTLDIFQEKIAEIIDEADIVKVIVASLSQSMTDTDDLKEEYSEWIEPIPLPLDKRFVSWQEFFEVNRESLYTCQNAELPAFVTYTGGTTGGSKGALLSNQAVLASAKQYILGEINLKRESTWLHNLPLYIAYGASFALTVPFIVGMTIIIRVPATETFSYFLKKFRPNHVAYVPTYWENFSEENEDIDLSNLITPFSAGDTLRLEAEIKINTYLKRQGCPYMIMNAYGMTEVGPAVSSNFSHVHELGSVGIPFAKNTISAFEIESGKELKYGEEGEICIQTPSVMIGYLNKPEETSHIIRKHEDGELWVHTGDLGYINKDGFIHISGRLKRFMIHVSDKIQKKIFSMDIEKILLAYPKVENCAVVPIADPIANQVPVAFIILKEEYRSESGVESEIKRYCAENLAEGYCPLKYYFVEKFPLTKVGKVNYLELEKIADNALL